jgi:hypothetical protein
MKMYFLSYFDIHWVKISYFENNLEKHLLLSNSGAGLVMKKIRQQNAELLNILKNLKNNVA